MRRRAGLAFVAVLALAAGLLGAGPGLARTNHALLIGVNSYPNLDPKWWLKGPSNDVGLVAQYLTDAAPVPFDAANITVLTSGGQEPTLAAIRRAFAEVQARLVPGDFVYLHFSGHGTQAPTATPETEVDGLDEVFLPADIGPWDNAVGAVQNALLDDELGRMIDGLRGKGADVWAVFDSCHSGTVTRAGPAEGAEETRSRQLPPEVLGVAADATLRGIGAAPAVVDAPFAGGAASGRLVAFFAAQTNEVTPERNLPRGKPGRKPMGVFTYTLMEALAEYPGATYGQIAQEVLRKYAVGNLARSTPLFEGDLAAVAFGAAPGGRVAQWPAGADLAIAAGSLHGLAVGDVLAVMPAAAASTDQALGFAELTEVAPFRALARAVVRDGRSLPADLPEGLFLRRREAAVDFTLTVARPAPGSVPAAVIDALAGPRLRLVDAGAEADVALAVLPDSPRPGAIWVLPGAGFGGGLPASGLDGVPSVATEGRRDAEVTAALDAVLTGMGRAVNLMRLGAQVGAGDLAVEVEMQTRSATDPALRTLPLTPVLRAGDEVHVRARNLMDGPVDVNVLYVAADYAISHWYSGRLQPGDEVRQGLFRITDDVLGAERMVVVLTPALPQSAVEDLSFLAQPSVELTRGAGSALSAALLEAGFGETTRGATGLGAPAPGGPAPGILQFELRTVAAD